MEKMMSAARPQRKPTNLSLDQSLLAEARELKINLSRAAEAGVRQEIARTKAELWKAENASAIESSNRWVEANGLPLARYRRF
jgi:antitoxin CcdA